MKTKLLLAVILLGMSFSLYGQQSTRIFKLEAESLDFTSTYDRSLTWTMTEPVEREDGTPIASNEISAYVLNCAHPTKNIEVERIVERNSMTVINGEVRYVWNSAVSSGVPYICKARTVDTNGLQSKWSHTIQLSIDIETPFDLRIR